MQFNQPDTVIPELYNPQSLNRYSYVNNNPIRYNDPTGHMRVADQDMQLNHASMNCSKYSQYCNNGKPKSSDELAKMRNRHQDNNILHQNQDNDAPNPSVAGLVVVAALLHVTTTLTELGVVAGEAALALGPDELVPQLAIPLGVTLAVAGAAVLDLDVSFLSYTFRVATHPDIHQDFVLMPPWGLNH
jgi:hypothetical protein